MQAAEVAGAFRWCRSGMAEDALAGGQRTQGIHHVPVHLECDWLAKDTKPSASISGQPKAAPLLLLGSETNSSSSGWECCWAASSHRPALSWGGLTCCCRLLLAHAGNSCKPQGNLQHASCSA